MDDTFFDGHDELYHPAKFGKDRTTRAGCRCENVVLVFFTGRMPRSGKLPVLFLLTGQKSGFSPRRGCGRLVAPIQVKLCKTDGHLGRLGCQNFTSIAPGGGNAAPKISKISIFLVNSSPVGATPLTTDFQNFYGLLYA